ncbi:MAG: response regulator [Gammaproteobacteria bacterium]
MSGKKVSLLNITKLEQELLSSIPGTIYCKNADGVYIACNDALVQTADGKILSDVVGKTDRDLWPELADVLRQNDLKVMRMGMTMSFEEPIVLPKGDRLYFISLKSPLKDEDGNIVGVIGNSLNITELKDALITTKFTAEEAKAKAEAASKAKSEFISVVSHELRTPLTGLVGLAELLGRQSLTPKQHNYVKQIQQAGKHLTHLINEILDFSKIEAGKFELSPAPVDLKALVEEVVTLLTHQAKTRGLELLSYYDNQTPHCVIADARAIRQILLNLIGNAIKFTPHGYISVSVTSNLDQNDSTPEITLSVQDSGIGIASDKQQLIFEYFQQVESSQSRQYGGTGLGLAVTKRIVEMMDGKITVQSEPGKGSTFSCTFKFPLQDVSLIKSPWSDYQLSVRILIVNDSLRGEVLRRQLNPSNTEVVIKGEDVINTLIAGEQLREPYHIVIVDDQVKDVLVFSLAKKILTICKQPPMLVLLMENDSLLTRIKAFNAGYVECIVKPIQSTELQVSLTASWEKWNQRSEKLKQKFTGSKKPYVLLVEDHPIVQMVHREYLKELGCVVDSASNGEQALELIRNNQYELIFLDIGLPDMLGTQLIQRHRSNEIEALHLPIVALTGYQGEEDRQTILSSGADHVLLKPVSIDQLREILVQYCPEYIASDGMV